MLYPAYIHKDPGSAYGVTFPDFPGCFTAADELEALPRLAQEAVELWFEGEQLPVAVPSAPEQWQEDDRFQGGYWLLLPIDRSRLGGRAVRVNVSMPEWLLARIDAAAERRRLSRSAFLALAAEHEMGEARQP